jgi:diguanylate cyclase (GGDEF)-like protein
LRHPHPILWRAWLLCLLLIGLCLPSQASSLPPDTVRIHFHRDNADYSGWGLHLWGNDLQPSAQVSWTAPFPASGQDAFGVYFDVPIVPGGKTFGFVLHRGEQKNVPNDQYWFLDQHGREFWVLENSATLFSQPPAVAPQSASGNGQGSFLPLWFWFGLASSGLVGLIWWRLQRRTLLAEQRLQEQMTLLTEARSELGRQMDAFHQSEQRLRQLSGSDDLTGLPTRAGLQQALAKVQSRARRHEAKVALIFIDLDNFKTINDSEGHAAGDAVLKTIASRFTELLRESDIVARIGGDEFVVLAEDVADERAVAGIARKLIAAACTPVPFDGREHQVGASVGIAIYPSDSNDAATLLKQADSAMYVAKHAGKGQFRFYAEAANQLCSKEMALDRRMPGLAERAELAIQLLPVQQLDNGQVVLQEAFLRWRQPEGDYLPARDFIHIAESNGQIIALGQWMIAQACQLAATWSATNAQAAPAVAINLSLAQLQHRQLTTQVSQALQQSGLPAGRLVLEIPAAALREDGQLQINLYGLQAMGVQLALDKVDARTLTFAQLAGLPWRWIKLNAQGLRGSEAALHEQLWKSLLASTAASDAQLIATHIDSPALRAQVQQLACRYGEGYAIDTGTLLDPQLRG